MNKQDFKVLLSLFLFSTFLVLIIFQLVVPINTWYVLLILPSLPFSFFIVSLLDKLFTSLHKEKLLPFFIGGLVLLAILSSFVFYKPPVFSPYASDFLYTGTSQVNESQYNMIIFYDNYDDDSYVLLVNNNPLTVEYRFHSKFNYTYLTKTDPQSYPNAMRQIYPNVIKIGFLFIPLMIILVGLSELYPPKSKLVIDKINS